VGHYLKPLFRAFFITSLCAACVGFANAFTFRSSEGHFIAEFPEEPKFDETSAKSDDRTPLKQYTWEVDKGDTVYSVTMTTSKKHLNFNYDNGAAGFVKATNGKLISRQKLQMQGTEAREIFVEAGGYIFRDRMIFVDQRIYPNPVRWPARIGEISGSRGLSKLGVSRTVTWSAA
jgi:hypothetical protein